MAAGYAVSVDFGGGTLAPELSSWPSSPEGRLDIWATVVPCQDGGTGVPTDGNGDVLVAAGALMARSYIGQALWSYRKSSGRTARREYFPSPRLAVDGAGDFIVSSQVCWGPGSGRRASSPAPATPGHLRRQALRNGWLTHLVQAVRGPSSRGRYEFTASRLSH